ncbi:hypothetical protein, partial [Pseudomonas viridiflava]|uniref:hypothetical protein n=1 Tax=Pseudomonas viridiflava TaxID=33069 RepID=UPI00197F56C3
LLIAEINLPLAVSSLNTPHKTHMNHETEGLPNGARPQSDCAPPYPKSTLPGFFISVIEAAKPVHLTISTALVVMEY